MSGFEVTPEELQFTAKMLGELREELDAGLARLSADVAEVTDVRWTGGAAIGFGHGWREFADGAREILAALQRMADLLMQEGVDYAEVEAGIVRAIGMVA